MKGVALYLNRCNETPLHRYPLFVRTGTARQQGATSIGARGNLTTNDLAPGVAGVGGLHSPEDFAPLARAAVIESNRVREAIR